MFCKSFGAGAQDAGEDVVALHRHVAQRAEHRGAIGHLAAEIGLEGEGNVQVHLQHELDGGVRQLARKESPRSHELASVVPAGYVAETADSLKAIEKIAVRRNVGEEHADRAQFDLGSDALLRTLLRSQPDRVTEGVVRKVLRRSVVNARCPRLAKGRKHWNLIVARVAAERRDEVTECRIKTKSSAAHTRRATRKESAVTRPGLIPQPQAAVAARERYALRIELAYAV